MHGVKRVLVFCVLIVILPATLIIIPLYLRKTAFANVTYPVAESDIIEIRDGISSIFCQKHSLTMNSKFNAFQLSSKPEISTSHKHIRLKKSMTLPDDTFEYWGFYLLKGAMVHLKFCSRYDGSRILVVKGQRELRTCGLLDHNKNKMGANYAQGHEQVKVFFEDMTEIAENIPAAELGKNSGNQSNIVSRHFSQTQLNHMDEENHGGEEIDDDDTWAQKDLLQKEVKKENSTVIPEPSTTRRPRKKLKKGTVYHKSRNSSTPMDSTAPDSSNNTPERHRNRRHYKSSGNEADKIQADRRQVVYEQLYKPRKKREHVYDRKYSHGGNAANFTETDESNSISSFETGLFECFDGNILLAEGFPPSADCLNTNFLEKGSHRMLSNHEISEDGYYYYIFYSDNDLVRNDIHAIFDIYKPTFQYSNLTGSQGCLNATNCTFPINFMSDEIVVVEVPTRDGIEHEEDDITYLISTCHPRTEIYAIFPIAVLLLILGCSFL